WRLSAPCTLSPSLFSLSHAPPPPVLYTLSLHDALPIWPGHPHTRCPGRLTFVRAAAPPDGSRADHPPHAEHRRHRGPVPKHCPRDRKSTRLNSSHVSISYAVFCLKKKKKGHIC